MCESIQLYVDVCMYVCYRAIVAFYVCACVYTLLPQMCTGMHVTSLWQMQMHVTSLWQMRTNVTWLWQMRIHVTSLWSCSAPPPPEDLGEGDLSHVWGIAL